MAIIHFRNINLLKINQEKIFIKNKIIHRYEKNLLITCFNFID